MQHVEDKQLILKESVVEEHNVKIRHQNHHWRYQHEHKSHHHDHRWGPYFEDGQNFTTLAVPVGGTMHLDCRVGMLQDKTVSIYYLISNNIGNSQELVCFKLRAAEAFNLLINTKRIQIRMNRDCIVSQFEIVTPKK